ncbi:large-conductance mechanosensitive channel protein MscL [Bacteroides pyogenes]|uniref:large-conductance mechanosensitive channel protein MscL n=1 Tax=Bacteroides pyogenes TaxID=310300 RepID=UPI000E174A3A|nr:large-conductance mechanosensitive channel protein MscL [Bacteroides pyogenes]MBB3895254.1 large conductance mechanosensitive channel [Bacteroides pyogenes]SUV30837.1 large conductance mechanosensitive channel protein [Bacteroides pyogenes]
MGKSTFLQDFKAFAMKGNVVDMAVGVIIGGAFGKIVSSVVADIIMPPIGLLLGGMNFTDLKWVLKPAEVVDGKEVEAVTMNYGQFLQNTIDFIIIAFSIFLVIRLVMKLVVKKEEEPETPPAPTKEEVLLAEIRDLLKDKK